MKTKYVRPEDVTAPKRRWSLMDVLYDAKEKGAAVALGRWDGNRVLAMRWNGNKHNSLGSPQSRGTATWFIVPEEFRKGIIATLSSDKRTLAKVFLQAGKS